ncbi:hypothetical protein BGZ82_005277 [Podila clonocystis]|nr:hypothetical protein BGZ82_005277 [Podila clonocystis]
MGLLFAAGVATSATLAPFAVVGFVTALGFTSGGILAGSTAAGIMSSYGGSVAAGSACAVLQSIGAAGLSGVATAIASTVGGAAAATIAVLV